MAFIPSNNIYIYPAYNRNSGINPESKLGTEFNLTSALANLVTQNGGSFVVSYSSPNIVMCIHGYLIQADLTGIVTNSGDWYAHLVYSNKGGSTYTNLLELTPSGGGTNLDNDDNFKGLVIDNNETLSNSYTLKILSSGKVPEESYHKFNLNQLHSYVNSNYVIRKNSDLYLETEDVAHHNDYHPLEDDETFYALVYGDLYSRYYYKDLTTQSPSASGNTTSFIDTISQASDGKIIATKKSFTLEATATQGQLSLNGTAINIKDLKTTDSPTFAGLTLSGNAAITGSVTLGSSLNHYSLVNSNANKFEIEYDKSGNAISVSASVNADFSDNEQYNIITLGNKGYLRFCGNPTINGTTNDTQLTYFGSATFAAGNYSSVTTTGKETITVAGNSFNVVTRDTAQTISGDKTFSGTTSVTGKATFSYTNPDPSEQNDPAIVVDGKIKFNHTNTYSTAKALLTLDSNSLLAKFTGTIGGVNQPIYLKSGVPTVCNTYSMPTTAGTAGQLLKSRGSGNTPEWVGLYEHTFIGINPSPSSGGDFRIIFKIISTQSTKYVEGKTAEDYPAWIGKALYDMGYIYDYTSATCNAVMATGNRLSYHFYQVCGAKNPAGEQYYLRLYAIDSDSFIDMSSTTQISSSTRFVETVRSLI